MVNWPIFSNRHRSTAIPNFRLRKIAKLLECHFNTYADSWSYRAIFGVARAFQNLCKFAFLYGKIVLGNFVTAKTMRLKKAFIHRTPDSHFRPEPRQYACEHPQMRPSKGGVGAFQY